MRLHSLTLATFVASTLLGCGGAGAAQRTAGSSAVAGHRESPPVSLHERAGELFEAGRDAAARGDTIRAEQYLSAAIERGYDRGKALPLLLDACLSSSRLRAALTHAEPYLRDHPEDDGLRYLVAIVHMGLGQTSAARLALDELLRRNEKSPEAHLVLGILDFSSDPITAREHFLAYLELAPRGERAAEARSRLAELAVLTTEKHRLATRMVSAGEPERGDVRADDNDAALAATDEAWREVLPINDRSEKIRERGPRP
jgi:tetratricopeptide (TPR) repeat protein